MSKLNYILEELLFESRRKDTIKKIYTYKRSIYKGYGHSMDTKYVVYRNL